MFGFREVREGGAECFKGPFYNHNDPRALMRRDGRPNGVSRAATATVFGVAASAGHSTVSA